MIIPEKFKGYAEKIPLLKQVVNWELLRKWSLSEVYRASLAQSNAAADTERRTVLRPYKPTVIIKWGGGDMAREASIYADCITPLGVNAPVIYDAAVNGQEAILLMEDVGPYNLEDRPMASQFVEAARELARLRKASAHCLNELSGRQSFRLNIAAYTIAPDHFLDQLEGLLHLPACSTSRGKPILNRTQTFLLSELPSLNQSPLTLVHHDYHAKNLVVQGERIIPVDWSNAYINSHLGDLYCLITEARSYCGLTDDSLLDAYAEETRETNLTRKQLDKQLQTGGLCWLIRSLHWLAAGGTRQISGSDTWIPGMLEDMERLLDCQL